MGFRIPFSPCVSLLVLLSFCAGAVACRSLILEDRDLCPARLTLTAHPPMDGNNWAYMKLRLWNEKDGAADMTVRADSLNEGLQLDWEKETMCRVSGLSGWTVSSAEEGWLLIPEGKECPEALGGFLQEKVARDETYHFPFDLRKLYVNLFFDISGAASEYPFLPVVRGAVDGYSVPSFALHGGSYRCETRMLNYWLRTVRIPRQRDVGGESDYSAGLKADFLFRTESGNWERFLSLPVGDILTAGGYDWGAPMPEDIHVGVTLADGAITRLTVQVNDWTQIVYNNGKLVI